MAQPSTVDPLCRRCCHPRSGDDSSRDNCRGLEFIVDNKGVAVASAAGTPVERTCVKYVLTTGNPTPPIPSAIFCCSAPGQLRTIKLSWMKVVRD